MKVKNKIMNELVEAFNSLYPIGTELFVVDDFGVEHKRKLLSKAWVIGDHSAIAKFEGISGGYNILRVNHRMKYKFNDLGMSYRVPADANGEAV